MDEKTAYGLENKQKSTTQQWLVQSRNGTIFMDESGQWTDNIMTDLEITDTEDRNGRSYKRQLDGIKQEMEHFYGNWNLEAQKDRNRNVWREASPAME